MKTKAQSILEYVTLLAIIGLALGTMEVYFRRGIQAGIKVAADELGLQEDGEKEFDPEKGVKIESNVTTVTKEHQEGGTAWFQPNNPNARPYRRLVGLVTGNTTSKGTTTYISEGE